MAGEIKIKVVLDTTEVEKGTQKIKQSFKSALDGATSQVNALKTATSGLSTVLLGLGGIAVFKQIAQFGVDLDKSRNAMTALTGSTQKANEKLAELRKLAKESPGVTTSFATQLFQQLKAIGGVADSAINNVIKSIGKLNTVFSDIGPEFVRNIVQIFQQGFERADIKEALGRVPIFEQLLKSAFGTDDPEKLRKLKAAGKLTLESFLAGFSNAINTDPRLKDVTESLGGRLQKALDETKQKLGETGEKILQVLLPALDKLLPVVNGVLRAFQELPAGLQATTIGILAISPAITPAISAVKALTVAFLGLSAAAQASLGIIGAILIGGGLAVKGFQDMIARNQSSLNAQLNQGGRLDITGKPIFQDLSQGVEIGGEFSLLKSPGRFSRALPTFDQIAGTFGSAQKALAATGGIGGGGAGRADSAARAAAKKRAEEIKDLQEQLRKAIIDDFATTTIADLNEIERTVTGINLEGVRSEGAAAALRAARPAQLAGHSAILAERIRLTDVETATLERNTAEQARKELEKNEQLLSNSQRLMRGFADATITVGDAFDRLGQSVAFAFGNVRDLFAGLKRAVLDFFNDLIGGTLQNLVRGTLGGLFGGGGSLSNLFRTPSTFPASVSQSSLGGFMGKIFGGGGDLDREASSAASSVAGGGFSFGGLLGGFVSAAPFLGAGLGAGIGGTSTLGNIFGTIGGGAAGLGASFGAGVFGAGGGIGQAALAALGPIALIGAPLLIGGFLLGKAKQRGSDEEASGQFLRQALDGLEQLRAGIASGAIDGSQARSIFESQILGQFIQQINTLKTKSVRESRLKNQVQDLRNVYDAIIPPAIAQQAQARSTSASNALNFSRQIPEFASGGTTLGGLALLHPGEKVLNLQQQTAMRAMGGSNIFERAGVPGLQQNPVFDGGGTFGRGFDLPIEINIDAQLVVNNKTAEGIHVVGASSPSGRAVTVNNIKVARTNREL